MQYNIATATRLLEGFNGKLYGVEKQAKDSDAATRHRNRQQLSVPILQKFHAWLLKTQQQMPPKTALGKTVNYTLDYWPELSRYIENRDWPIDNNPADNAIFPFVIGRKAWLFSHSQLVVNVQARYQSCPWNNSRLPSMAITQ